MCSHETERTRSPGPFGNLPGSPRPKPGSEPGPSWGRRQGCCQCGFLRAASSDILFSNGNPRNKHLFFVPASCRRGPGTLRGRHPLSGTLYSAGPHVQAPPWAPIRGPRSRWQETPLPGLREEQQGAPLPGAAAHLEPRFQHPRTPAPTSEDPWSPETSQLLLNLEPLQPRMCPL